MTKKTEKEREESKKIEERRNKKEERRRKKEKEKEKKGKGTGRAVLSPRQAKKLPILKSAFLAVFTHF